MHYIFNFAILTKFHTVKETNVIKRTNFTSLSANIKETGRIPAIRRQVIKNIRRRKGKCKMDPLLAALRKTRTVFRHLYCRKFGKFGLFQREPIVLIWVSQITTTIT